ncbi:MAG: type II toxin-antitoxin system RelE/ParE family toxin [Solirubrobacteraceae bacterium]
MTRQSAMRHNVIYDPDAVAELLMIKSKQEHRALVNAVEKLRELGDRLGPPHMKPLQGVAASSLCELRPRRGDSDWRAVYRRVGVFFVILAIDRHKNFAAMVERAQHRAGRYGERLENR